ncbi:hypothetical protein CTAYLR_007099 [Chrysophaeum taylorii]|uniref:Uncharacterized protein n=1 Tax=Chrysophaeum taylorii TaxID=2483200 RepID=A0AAD7XNT6_9STRA|nr:hypothetical protein CTAYLR_007099 [Chrysophaeum taylorii]
MLLRVVVVVLCGVDAGTLVRPQGPVHLRWGRHVSAESSTREATHKPLFVVVRGGDVSRGTPAELVAASKPKVHPAWDGDCVDLVVGACFGGVAGVVFSFTLTRVASAVVMAASNIAFSALVIWLGTAQGFLSVHTNVIRNQAGSWLQWARALPIIRKIDARRRRRWARTRRRTDPELSFLHLLDGGGVEQLEEIATRNEHAVLGVMVGFIFGLIKGAQI